MAPQAPYGVKANVKVTKDNGLKIIEAEKGLLEVWEVIKCQGENVSSNKWGPDAPVDDI